MYGSDAHFARQVYQKPALQRPGNFKSADCETLREAGLPEHGAPTGIHVTWTPSSLSASRKLALSAVGKAVLAVERKAEMRTQGFNGIFMIRVRVAISVTDDDFPKFGVIATAGGKHCRG